MWTQWTKIDFSPVTPILCNRLTVGTPYFSKRILAVGGILRHVDVTAHARVLCNANAFFNVSHRRR